jgi:acetate---CoA ligase (ADP-forming)
VAYLAEDEACRAIACVLEGMPDPQRLIEAAELAWKLDKPLLIHKIAIGEQGAAAAMSHTGTLAGSNAAYMAAFERAGAIAVPDFEALMETASFFAKASTPKARGVAVCATSGGAAIMAADKAELHGIPLPQPSDEALAILKQHVPEFGSARNPCDVTAQVLNSPGSLQACGEALMSDPGYGALIVPQPVAFNVHVPRIGVFGELARQHGKIACNVLLSDWLQGPASREAEEHPHVAMFRSMERCFRALAAWHQRSEWRATKAASAPERIASASAMADAARLLDSSRNTALTEREAKGALALYGVPVVGERLVQSAAEAVAAAESLGLPVALKVESPDLPHKTEAGVIRLDLRTAAAVEQAYEAVMANARKVEPPPRLNGVLVQPMVPSGAEVMVGARVDPQFGPLVVVGLGGILVELLKDTQVALAPVDRDQARAMLLKLKGVRLLQGFRGSAPVDIDRLADVVARISEFAADHAGRVQEIDVNPLICAGDRIIAVDALIVRRQAAGSPQTKEKVQ